MLNYLVFGIAIIIFATVIVISGKAISRGIEAKQSMKDKSEDKKRAAFATSSGVPNLSTDIFSNKVSLKLSFILSVISDFIKPGEIQFIFIFFFPYSKAKLFDIPIKPAFEAA